MGAEKSKNLTFNQSIMGGTMIGAIFYPMAIGPVAADAFDGTFDDHRLRNTYDPENDPGRIEHLKNGADIEGEDASFFSYDTVQVSSGDVGELIRAGMFELFLAWAVYKGIQGVYNNAKQQATQGGKV